MGVGNMLLVALLIASSSIASATPFGNNKIPDNNEILVSYGAAEASELSRAQVVRLAVWNVQKLGNNRTLEHLLKLTQNSDFVLLQETMMGGAFDQIFNSIEDFGWFGAVSFLNKKKHGTGVSTGSRVQASYSNYVQSHAREPILKTPKMIMISKYRLKGASVHGGPADGSDELLVANIHGINFVRTEKYESQIKQMTEVLLSHQGPMIIAGDFNTHSISRAVIVRNMADKLQMNFVRMENERYNRLVVDHIFVRGFSVDQSKVLFDINSSDHYPIVANLRFE